MPLRPPAGGFNAWSLRSQGLRSKRAAGTACGSFCCADARRPEELDCFFEILRRAKRDLLARLNLDRLAGRGVASHTSGALRTCRMPSPAMRMRLPFFRCFVTKPIASLSISSDRFFANSCCAASAAARCLSVTVAWTALGIRVLPLLKGHTYAHYVNDSFLRSGEQRP